MILIIWKQGREIKLLNTLCNFLWVYLLELVLEVATTQLPESEEVYLSIRVRVIVGVTINRLTGSDERKIYLRWDGQRLNWARLGLIHE